MTISDLSYRLAVLAAGRSPRLPAGADPILSTTPPPAVVTATGGAGVPLARSLVALALLSTRARDARRSAYLWITGFDAGTTYTLALGAGSVTSVGEANSAAIAQALADAWTADGTAAAIAEADVVSRPGTGQPGVRLRQLAEAGVAFDPGVSGGTGTIDAEADAETATVVVSLRPDVDLPSSIATALGVDGVQRIRGFREVQRVDLDATNRSLTQRIESAGYAAAWLHLAAVAGVVGDDGDVALRVGGVVLPAALEGAS